MASEFCEVLLGGVQKKTAVITSRGGSDFKPIGCMYGVSTNIYQKNHVRNKGPKQCSSLTWRCRDWGSIQLPTFGSRSQKVRRLPQYVVISRRLCCCLVVDVALRCCSCFCLVAAVCACCCVWVDPCLGRAVCPRKGKGVPVVVRKQ